MGKWLPYFMFSIFLLNCRPVITDKHGYTMRDITSEYTIVCMYNIKYLEGYRKLTPYINPETKTFENCVKEKND